MKTWVINKLQQLRAVMKFSVSNPVNFEEVFSFQSTWQRVISLAVLVILIFSGLTFYLFVLGPFAGEYGTQDITIERKTLESQAKEIESLKHKLAAHEAYIDRLKKITNGEIPVITDMDSNVQAPNIDFDKINDKMSPEEQTLMEEVRKDMRTQSDKSENELISFFPPLKGVISQKFQSGHTAIDIVVKEGTDVLSCQSGVIIYSGYTLKDGYVIIIDHGNGYVSVYKHNKLLVRKQGDRIRPGEIIAKAGTTGENSSGPHLHFELLYQGKAIDPAKYINFTD